MRVKELIKWLQELPEESNVFIPEPGGITDNFFIDKQGWQIRLTPDSVYQNRHSPSAEAIAAYRKDLKDGIEALKKHKR